jgi:integrase
MDRRISNFLASNLYAKNTKDTYAHILNELVEHEFPKWEAGELFGFIERENWGDSKRYVALNACKSFIRFLYGKDHPALSAKIKRVKSKPQRALTYDQLLILLALFDTYTADGARNQCIVALAIDTAFRVQELSSIKLADVDRQNRTILVITKGGNWRYGVYSEETGAILERWLSYRKPADGTNGLFTNLKEDYRYGRPISKAGIQTLFKRWSAKIGFKVSPHDLRRGMATLTTINNAPTRIVQVAGRWSDIAMVEHYTRTIEAQAIQQYLPMHNLPKKKLNS